VEVKDVFQVEKDYYLVRSIRMTEKLKNQLEHVAYENDIFFNRRVVQCCEYALAHRAYPDREQK
jgi:hypothetical protein